MKVHILLEEMPAREHIVGVFKTYRAAILYAEKFNIKSWHINSYRILTEKDVK